MKIIFRADKEVCVSLFPIATFHHLATLWKIKQLTCSSIPSGLKEPVEKSLATPLQHHLQLALGGYKGEIYTCRHI